jgi:hypothetical protein
MINNCGVNIDTMESVLSTVLLLPDTIAYLRSLTAETLNERFIDQHLL